LGADGTALECLKEVVRDFPGYGENIAFQECMINLAVKTGDLALTRQCQETVRRLSGNTNAGGIANPATSKSSITNH
jgi:hypothetical protein